MAGAEHGIFQLKTMQNGTLRSIFTYDAAGDNIMEFLTANVVSMVILASGGVNIGAANDPGDNNLYVVGDVNCASVTDHTPSFRGDALKLIKKIARTEHDEIDHNTLPKFVQRVYRDDEGKEKIGRDLGGMISILTEAIKQLVVRVEALENVV
jgi:hypothetical protein